MGNLHVIHNRMSETFSLSQLREGDIAKMRRKTLEEGTLSFSEVLLCLTFSS